MWGEQGVGDEILSSSMIPDLARDCKLVIMDTHPRLTNLFREAFGPLGNVIVYGTRKESVITWPSWHKVDFKISIGSLGRFYRRKAEDFPAKRQHLRPLEPLAQKWRERLQAVGFSDEDIWDIGAVTAFFSLSNRLVSLAGTPPNPEFYLMGRVPRAAK